MFNSEGRSKKGTKAYKYFYFKLLKSTVESKILNFPRSKFIVKSLHRSCWSFKTPNFPSSLNKFPVWFNIVLQEQTVLLCISSFGRCWPRIFKSCSQKWNFAGSLMVPDENAIFILVCMFESAKGRWNWGEGAIATSISQIIEFRLWGA